MLRSGRAISSSGMAARDSECRAATQIKPPSAVVMVAASAVLAAGGGGLAVEGDGRVSLRMLVSVKVQMQVQQLREAMEQ